MFKEYCPHCEEEQMVDNRPPEYDDQDPAGNPIICFECGNTVYAH